MNGYLMNNLQGGISVNQMTDSALTIRQIEWLGITAGQTVLDLGCDAGTTCRIMSSCVGSQGQVIGIDASKGRIQQARFESHGFQNIEYHVGMANAIPVATDSVDVAWSRFLFEYLGEPQAALAEMIRVTRPGGVVCVADLDGNSIWHEPIDAELKTEIKDALATFDTSFAPHAGRRLHGWFAATGLEEIAVDVRPFHLIAGHIHSTMLEHWRLKLQGVAEALIGRGWSNERVGALIHKFEHRLKNPSMFTYSSLITVRGRKAG